MFFVGRSEELRIFEGLLLHPEQRENILHMHGIGGLGKSFLLDRFHSLSEANGALFLYMDSRDFIHTPRAFIEKLMELAFASSDMGYTEKQIVQSVQDGLKALNHLAASKPLILALDTYENMTDMDYWLRESFISRLHERILVIISGRNPLSGSWSASPVWRTRIKRISLQEFDYCEVKAYLHKFDVTDEHEIEFFWNYTHGHPLALSLAVASVASDPPNVSIP